MHYISIFNRYQSNQLFSVIQEWTVEKYKWAPEQFDNLTSIHYPADKLWLPDLTLMLPFAPLDFKSKFARINFNGSVTWIPLAVVQCYCPINLDYYPFDIQTCKMIFQSWTYDGTLIWITLKDLPDYEKFSLNGGKLKLGMDLSEYMVSSELELLSLPVAFSMYYYPKENLTEPYPCKHAH